VNSRVLYVVLAVSLFALVIIFAIRRQQGDSEKMVGSPRLPPESESHGVPAGLGQKTRSSVLPLMSRSVSPTSISENSVFDEAPSVLELAQTHDGFLDSYRASVVNNPPLRRALLRCLRWVPDGVSQMSYRVVNAFRVGGDGVAEVTGVSVQSTPNVEEYVECVESSYRSSAIEMPVPESISQGEFQVLDEATFYIDLELTRDRVMEHIGELQDRLESPFLSEDERPILQISLELYSCYLERGIDNRRECLGAI
jgi:hypothetical protein